MKFFSIFSAAAMIGFGSPDDGPSPYALVDITGEYARIYDQTADMPEEERIARTQAGLHEAFPGFYDTARMNSIGVSNDRYSAWIARSLENFADIRGDYRHTAREFADMLAPAHASFAEAFPDLEPIGDIYILHSLGEMDGGTRYIDERIMLVFGADRMATSPITDWTAFFHHELFHVYHFQQSFMGCPEMWCFLWIEGLATYVAATLNPGANDTELLLDWPEPIRENVDANLAEAVCAVGERFDSHASEDHGALFSNNRLNERLPPRFGYYVGKLVAREAAREMPLADLAKLTVDEARPVVERALGRLAECGDEGA
ncbi:hypothetical protein [Glycocaulis sp.]|uniref:hypothetical protein n=1 Tax=Glycocaulis sp. TaxID=1969725 RepID=UPI003D245788